MRGPQKVLAICVLLSIALFGNVASVSAAARYPVGIQGVNAATLPPAGFHYQFYYVNVSGGSLYGNDGNEVPIDFDLSVNAYTSRFLYGTGKKLFGADHYFSLTVPVTNISVEINGNLNSSKGLGDVVFAPVLISWRKPRHDVTAAISIIAPTGKYDKENAVNNGEGFWSTQFTFGGTMFFDDHRSLSASVLTRTIINAKNGDTDQKKGTEFTAEWGIGKSIKKNKTLIRPGLCGFAQLDVSDHEGYVNDGYRYEKYAIGAEVNVFWLPPTLFQANVRYLHEFGTKNAPQGGKFLFTVTKSF